MKHFSKNSILLAISIVVGVMGPLVVSAATSPTLTGASSYSVLGGSTVTNTGSTTTSGAVGVSAGTAITGFPPGVAGGGTHSNDASAIAAQTDNLAAFGTLNQGCDHSYADGQDLTLLSPLGPGVYCSAGSFALSGNLTLTGSGVWIFKSASTLITSPNSSITGGDPCNVWWRVGTSATLDTTTSFIGNIFAQASITMNTGATLSGRALAQVGAVTLDTNTISGPTCSVVAPILHLRKVVDNTGGGVALNTAWNVTATGTGGSPTNLSGTTPVDSGVSFQADTYTLAESGGPAGYTASTYSCVKNSGSPVISNSITLANGDTTTCTITNTYNVTVENITVVKVVVGGSKAIADFPLFIDGALVTSGATNSFAAPGSYTVTETSSANYSTTFSGSCPGGVVTLASGTPKICTITNTYTAPASGGGGVSYGIGTPVAPLIEVVKVPSPLSLPAGPGLVTYSYAIHNIGIVPMDKITAIDDSCSPLIYVSGDTFVDKRLDAGETWNYTCSTTLSATHTNTVVATGWASGVSATDVANATVVVGAPVAPPLIHVTKVPSPLTLPAGGGAVIYTEKASNPGVVALSNVKLIDDKCSPVAYISGDTNGDSKLDVSETWTYICQQNLNRTTTNTVTATGQANGITATDFAIATVIVATPKLPNTGLPQTGIFYRSLGVGSQGADVAALQTILEQKGLLIIPMGITKGLFGSLTRAAVIKYQTSVALPLAGVFGPMTRAKLVAELSR